MAVAKAPIARGSLLVPWTVLFGALAVQWSAATGVAMAAVAAVAVGAVGAAVLVRRGGLEWSTLLAAILAIILLIPINRYALPGSLPFEIEPYRLAVSLAIALWIAALLIDPRVRLRTSGFEAPLGLLVAATLASVVVNGDRVSELSGDVAKSLTFFGSFLLFFFMFVSVVRSRRTLDALIKLLVGGVRSSPRSPSTSPAAATTSSITCRSSCRSSTSRARRTSRSAAASPAPTARDSTRSPPGLHSSC